jgi:hypothetical protein
MMMMIVSIAKSTLLDRRASTVQEKLYSLVRIVAQRPPGQTQPSSATRSGRAASRSQGAWSLHGHRGPCSDARAHASNSRTLTLR